ncbi:type II toxin-antitoxin system RelE/ParE family toxin [Caulobacter sp.]|uniref:type II toxin-antitoxin system RelE/ParE family toxin n=1 Tax=Caulobacter sp. TaxID=78 RepID=UPI001B063BFE|nr:type II toxin-antitoxin system RelE/ParE family toxin [Caulobacter sp.]MBO9543683.1 type II toxin-antitoxin system RelE/ParE family toxin [Caulobacter sp.]
MVDVLETKAFIDWVDALRDRQARNLVIGRLYRLQRGLFGDARPVGGGVSELRIHVGPGYRIYFVRRGELVVVLLSGGDKGSQAADIERAKAMAEALQASDLTSLRIFGADP